MTSGLVLVVDDEPVGLEVVSALLHSAEYELHFASNGQEAIDKAIALRPDLILLDVLMPDMDGYTVCRHIRDNSLIADIPIILLTALNDRNAKIKGLDAGADDFISKPFDRLELSARVGTILRLNRYRSLVSERAKFAWGRRSRRRRLFAPERTARNHICQSASATNAATASRPSDRPLVRLCVSTISTAPSRNVALLELRQNRLTAVCAAAKRQRQRPMD